MISTLISCISLAGAVLAQDLEGRNIFLPSLRYPQEAVRNSTYQGITNNLLDRSFCESGESYCSGTFQPRHPVEMKTISSRFCLHLLLRQMMHLKLLLTNLAGSDTCCEFGFECCGTGCSSKVSQCCSSGGSCPITYNCCVNDGCATLRADCCPDGCKFFRPGDESFTSSR
jgi:hypothetical protein